MIAISITNDLSRAARRTTHKREAVIEIRLVAWSESLSDRNCKRVCVASRIHAVPKKAPSGREACGARLTERRETPGNPMSRQMRKVFGGLRKPSRALHSGVRRSMFGRLKPAKNQR